VVGSAISQTSESVGTAVNGSTIALPGSGMSRRSLSAIPCQPRIEDPSKPSPSVNADVPNALIGRVMCCQLPSRSQNFRSTSCVFCSNAHATASSASGFVPFARYALVSVSCIAPPLVHEKSPSGRIDL
jgi:hypothetical protein